MESRSGYSGCSQPDRQHAVAATATTRLRLHRLRLPRRARQKPKQKQRQGVVYEMMPMLLALRFMLMLPVTVHANGHFRFRWLSLAMGLTLAVWLLLVVLSYYLVRFHLDPVSDDRKHFHVWDLVLQYGAAIGVSYIAFMPYTSWATAGRVVLLLEQWQRVEARMTALRGDVLVLRLRARAMALSVACLAVPALIEVASSVFSPTAWHLWMLPILAHSVSYFMLATLFWNLSCYAIAAAARQMAEAMFPDFQRLGVRGLRAHRRVWLGLSKALTLLSATWGRTHTLVLGLLFASFATHSFLLMHIIVSNDMLNSLWWFAVSYVLTIWSIYSICNSAQHATDSLKVPATKQLLLMSLAVKDDATLNEIRLECPRVSVCRLAVLSRSSILSIFALANTYIVVLSQFTISVENAETNFTEDPGLGGMIE